jgi:hypothetical protein
MAITCVIRYEVDPFAYEAYRARLKPDPEARENSSVAQNKRLILREERNFVEVVEGTFGPSTLRKTGPSRHVDAS